MPDAKIGNCQRVIYRKTGATCTLTKWRTIIVPGFATAVVGLHYNNSGFASFYGRGVVSAGHHAQRQDKNGHEESEDFHYGAKINARDG